MRSLTGRGLWGREAALPFRLLAIARDRQLALSGVASAAEGVPGLRQVQRLLPRLKSAGEEGLLDVVEGALEDGPDRPAAALLRAARARGLPAESLREIAAWLASRQEARIRFFRAVSYPLTLTVAACTAASFLVVAVVGPLLSFSAGELVTSLGATMAVPWRVLAAVYAVPARLMSPAMAVTLNGLVLLVLGAGALWAGATLHERLVVLWIPKLERYVRLHAARVYAATLGPLLASGVAAPRALELAAQAVDNRALRDDLLQIGARVEAGESLGECFRETQALPRSAGFRLWAAYYRSDLPAELARTARDCALELESREPWVRAAASAAAMALAVVCLAPVWILVVAFYLPLFNLVGKLG